MPRPLLAACLSLLAASAGAQAVPAIPDLPPASAAARRRTPPSRDSLDGIASRGRLLAD